MRCQCRNSIYNHNLTPSTFASQKNKRSDIDFPARLEDASEGVYGDDVTPSKIAAEDRKLCSTQLEFDSFGLGKHRLRFTIILYIEISGIFWGNTFSKT